MNRPRAHRIAGARLGAVVLVLLVTAVPRAAAAQTRVVLRSSPDGATVTERALGYLGTTDVAIDLKRRSKVELLFTKAGYQDLRIGRQIKGKEMTIDVVLERSPATSITVRLDPPHARFRLSSADGALVLEGKSSAAYQLAEAAPWPGESRRFVLEASCPGYDNQRSEVVLDQYEHHDLAFTLTPIRTGLRVLSDPAGARVTEEALGYLGTTPFEVEISLEDLVRAGLVSEAGGETEVTLEFTVEKPGFDVRRRSERLSFGRERNEVKFLLQQSY